MLFQIVIFGNIVNKAIYGNIVNMMFKIIEHPVIYYIIRIKGRGFQHLLRDLANVNALKNHVRSLLLHKKLKTFATFRVISCTILFRLFTDVSRT